MKTCCPLAVLILIAGGCLLHGAEAHGQLLRSWRFFRRERPDRRTVSPTERALNPPPLAVAPFGFREAVGHQEAWATYLDRPVELTNSVGMELRLLPPGEFMMGSPESEEGRLPWEVPRHRVRITRPFYLGMYPVTQSQWESVMGRNPSYFSSEGRGGNWVSRFATGDFPVESVSWDDAQEFLQKLNEQSGEPGWVYRLPTEAEWEYACRAGTTMRYHFGDDVAYLGEYAWYSGNTGGWGKARPA